MQKVVYAVFALLFLLINTERVNAQSRFGFVENKGQWNQPFLFKADVPGGVMFLEPDGITYHLADWSELHEKHTGHLQNKEPLLKGHVVKVSFHGAHAPEKVLTGEPQSNYLNYYQGNDPSKWVNKVYPMGKVTYTNVWDGVDMMFYTAGGRLKYDFILQPGISASSIRLDYTGPDKMMLRDGSLILTTSLGEVVEEKPYAYQVINGEKVEVPCAYILVEQSLFFELGQPADVSLPVIIDPTIIFATYSGSTSDNFGMTATYSSNGELYAGGTAFGPGYPTTAGAYQTTATAAAGFAGITDVVITKYSSNGTSQIYSTYLGGGTTTSGTETVHSLIEDKNGNLLVYGVTSSNNFPVTPGAYDVSFGGGNSIYFPENGSNFDVGTDIYVAKFNTTGTALLGCTYVGGSKNDGVNHNTNPSLYDSLQFNYGDQFRGEVYVDSLDNIYVVSCTNSSDFPVVNAFQPVFGGAQDAVVFKLNPTLTSLTFSTYIGGSDKDNGCGMKLDDHLNIYFTGGTCSPDFPVTPGVYDASYNGGKADGYIAYLSADGDSLYKATFVGTNAYDQSYFLERDAYGTVYIFGQTLNPTGFPVINAIYSNANSGQFVMNIDSSLTNVIYASKFGNDNGGVNISPSAFRVDVCGNVYISGWGGNILGSTPTTGMPVTPDAFQGSSGDGFNFYIAVFKTFFDGIFFGSYFGGNSSREHVDGGTSRFSDDGFIYQSVCAGCGSNDDFPTTPGAWSNTNNSSNCNNGVFKIQFPLPAVSADINAPLSVCKDRVVNFTSVSTGANYIHWDFGDGGTSSAQNPSHQYNNEGTYTVTFVVIDTSFITCVSFDTAVIQVSVIDGDTTYSLPNVTICQGVAEPIGIASQAGHTYQWTPATALSSATISNPSAGPTATTNYVLFDSDSVCTDTINQTVVVQLPPNANFDYDDYVSCYGVSLGLNDLSTGADSMYYTLNGVPLLPGMDSVVLDWSQSYTIVQHVIYGECTDTFSMVFNAGNFADLFDLTMPNVFTPFVTLGLNDQFCPIGLDGEYCYQMYIYNRWGTEIWESGPQEPCWDGLHRDTDARAVDGVYYYVIYWGGGKEVGFLELFSEQP